MILDSNPTRYLLSIYLPGGFENLVYGLGWIAAAAAPWRCSRRLVAAPDDLANALCTFATPKLCLE